MRESRRSGNSARKFTPDVSQSRFLTSAERLSDLGFRVFPVHEPPTNYPCHDRDCATCGDKTPKDGGTCKKSGKRPAVTQPYRNATRNRALLERWASKCPGANIGIPTGGVNKLLAIDLDSRAALETFKTRAKSHGDPLNTWWVRTGRNGGKGWHVLFSIPRDCTIKSGSGVLGTDIDHRCNGGYIIGVGSWHRDGEQYQWLGGCAPRDCELAKAPKWLLDALRDAEKEERPTGTGHLRVVDVAYTEDFANGPPIIERQPSRNCTRAGQIGARWRQGWPLERTIEEQTRVDSNRCVPPEGPAAAEYTAGSVYRSYEKYLGPWRAELARGQRRCLVNEEKPPDLQAEPWETWRCIRRLARRLGQDHCSPSLEWIAEQRGKSIRTIQRHIKRISERHPEMLVVEEQLNNPNTYRLLPATQGPSGGGDKNGAQYYTPPQCSDDGGPSSPPSTLMPDNDLSGTSVEIQTCDRCPASDQVRDCTAVGPGSSDRILEIVKIALPTETLKAAELDGAGTEPEITGSAVPGDDVNDQAEGVQLAGPRDPETNDQESGPEVEPPEPASGQDNQCPPIAELKSRREQLKARLASLDPISPAAARTWREFREVVLLMRDYQATGPRGQPEGATGQSLPGP